MAGGKETPRQKMIGMMYLVLTALLALNVSTTVLDKFAFINQSLEQANNESASRNSLTIKGMKVSVKEKGDREEDLKVVEAAEKLRVETERVLVSLEEGKEKFIEITGGYGEGSDHDRMHIEGKTNYDKVGAYMMPIKEGGKGKGEEMKILLNDYVKYVKNLLKENGAPEKNMGYFKDLAVDANDDPYWSKDPNQKGKRWSELQFHDSPTHAALATVSEFQANVISYETTALDFLKKRVGLKDITFDEIKPVVMPESRYVAAGTKYKAEMFIAASASGLNDKIKMSYSGKSIPVSGGVGKVEFVATPGKYVEGKVKKQFKAAIKVPLSGGIDTTFSSDIEYFVTEPVISIQSQSVNALYYNCGNALDVQVPALGESYDPVFTANGADVIKGSKKGQVTVVPNGKNVTLNVASNGNKIGARKFGVRAIPAPAIKVFTDKGEVDLKNGISSRTPRLYIKAFADPSFEKFLPKDSRFRVAEAEVTYVSGGLGRGSRRVSDKIDIGSIAANARKGDQIVIEIKSVERRNFRKQVEDFPRYQKFISIPMK